MICKVRLEFRKLAKHTSHRRLQPAPLYREAGKEASQLSLQGLLATRHHVSNGKKASQLSLQDLLASCLKAYLSIMVQAHLQQSPRDLGSQSRPQLQAQASLANPTPQANAEYKVASQAAHKSALADHHHHFKCSQRCNTSCTRVT